MLRAILTIIICLWGSILMPLETHAVKYVEEIAKAKQAKDNEKLGKLLSGRVNMFYNSAMTDSVL